MLADQLDFVVGVDSHRDTHALAVVAVVTGVVVFEGSVPASGGGYAEALRLAGEHAPGRRAFAIEGTASYGAGLTRFLLDQDEQVFEVGRPRRERRSGGKTDALDAIRAARSVLTQKRGAIPRKAGEREALRALMAAREGAAIAKQAGLNQLYALLVTAPEPLREELRGLTRHGCSIASLRLARPRDAISISAARSLRSERLLGAYGNSRSKSTNWPARSTASSASSPRNCSTNPASARSWRLRSCSPGRIEDGSRTRPPSRGSPASHPSPPHPARRFATDLTAAAIES